MQVLRYDRHSFADVVPDGVELTECLASYQLAYSLKIQIASQGQVGQVAFSEASLLVDFITASSKHVRVGTALPLGPPVSFQTGKFECTHRATFLLALSPEQVERICELSASDDIRFSVALYGIAGGGIGYVPASCEELIFVVPRSDWLKNLERVGYCQTAVIEILLPPKVAPGFEEALRYLKRAKEQFGLGQYYHAVGDCRLVLESTARALGKNPTEPPMRVDKQKQMLLTKHERLDWLHQVSRVITHLGHHTNPSDAIAILDREDAALVVRVTAAIVRHAISGGRSQQVRECGRENDQVEDGSQ